MMTSTENWNIQTRKNTMNLAFWTFTWTASLALATFGPKLIWSEGSMMTILGILLNAAFGVGMILANIRYTNGLDELQKKIQLEAMAIALGVGIVGGLSYSLLDTTNIISMDAEISVLIMIIGLTYLTAVVVAQFRYK